MSLEAALKKGIDQLRAGDQARAEKCFRAILDSDSRNLAALNLLAVVLMQQKRFADAEPYLRMAAKIDPGSTSTIYNHALALSALSRPAEALALLDKVVALSPQDGAAWNSRGLALAALRRHEAALASFDTALSFSPGFAETHYHRAQALKRLSRPAEAAASYVAAFSTLSGDYNLALACACASGLQQLHRHAEAIEIYNGVLAKNPRHAEALAQSLRAQMHLCIWDDYEWKVAALVELAQSEDLLVSPFSLFSLPLDRVVLRRSAERFTRTRYPAAAEPIWSGERYDRDRVRVAYVSTDFREHPVAHLIAELFEQHDRSRFEIFGFSISPKAHDRMARRIANAFDEFHDVSGRDDDDIADLLRKLEIDIAVDLNGFTTGCRPGIFNRRATPVQVNYLGFPGAMGASYIDYIIADPTLVPPHHFDGYSAKVVHLPHSFQPNDSTRLISEHIPTRAELGLPDDGFVFCCFNNSYKITPDVFAIWMRLLARVSGSVLWLRQDNPDVRANLTAQAKRHGIAPERLVFAGRTPTLADHLARQKQADLFLDTFYYNAHTTASDALWAGLPIVTLIGETYASRVAASLLHALGLPELVTRSHAEYEELIYALASDPVHLTGLRERLTVNIETRPLFDAKQLTRHLEQAYLQMQERVQRGEPPAHVTVAP